MEVAITAETYGVCPRCPKCKEEVLGGNFGKLNDQFYHAGCLKCKECGNFADCDTAKFRHDDVFCLPCYAKLYWFRCSVCSKPMNPRETLQVYNMKRHFECYQCTGCGKVMHPYGQQFDINGNVFCTIECGRQKLQKDFEEAKQRKQEEEENLAKQRRQEKEENAAEANAQQEETQEAEKVE